jgi:hypothetical protein
MTGQQRAVLWIGLILVGLNLVSHWKEITTVIFSGAGITGGIAPAGTGTGSGFKIPIPFPPSIGLLSHPATKTQTTVM